MAVAIVIVYQITGIPNFAFGAFGMVAAFSFDTLTEVMSPWAAFALVVFASIFVGAGLGVLARPLQASSEIVKKVVPLGLLTALGPLVFLIWGNNVRTVPTLANTIALHLGGIAITWQRVIAVIIGIVGTAAGAAFFNYGRLGSALRAMATDNEISKLVGLPVNWLWVLAWILSTVTASFAIILILPELGLDTDALSFVILIPLAAALAARFRSLTIAFVSALGLGIVSEIFNGNTTLAPYADALPLAVALLSIALLSGNQTYERV